MRLSPSFALALLAALSGACSKENKVNVNNGNGDPDASPGTLGVGDACTAASECQAGLTCLFGLCRAACGTDAECGPDSLCLGDGSQNGCRLPDEKTCSTSPDCPNSVLACGVDKTCRIACSANKSCPRLDQNCIAGACVSTTESNYKDTYGTCDPKQAGQILCDGTSLWSCSLTTPGRVEHGTCASAELCQQAVDKNSTKCPVCGPGGETARCTGTSIEVCSADFSGFVPTECGAQQCNPSAGACFALDIDQKEVTRAEYAAVQPTLPPGTGACKDKLTASDYLPDATCMQNTKVCKTDCDSHPQVCVDWCDAQAYCASKGRRLCGRIGGGMVLKDSFADPGLSQWMNACSSGGQNDFTFGKWTGPESGQICNVALMQLQTTAASGSLGKCHSTISSYAGPFDLTGNAAEWEDSCDKTLAQGAAGDSCRVRGGSFEQSSQADLGCTSDRVLARNTHLPDIGFRCCGL